MEKVEHMEIKKYILQTLPSKKISRKLKTFLFSIALHFNARLQLYCVSLPLANKDFIGRSMNMVSL